MKNKIIEIIELGGPKSLIHRENEPITELIQTTDLVDELNQQLRIGGVSHSMTGDGMNCLEFYDMIKKEWCRSEEQYKPFWNDVLTFARKYHKERKEYCG